MCWCSGTLCSAVLTLMFEKSGGVVVRKGKSRVLFWCSHVSSRLALSVPLGENTNTDMYVKYICLYNLCKYLFRNCERLRLPQKSANRLAFFLAENCHVSDVIIDGLYFADKRVLRLKSFRVGTFLVRKRVAMRAFGRTTSVISTSDRPGRHTSWDSASPDRCIRYAPCHSRSIPLFPGSS